MHREYIIVKGGENNHFLCVITLYQHIMYEMDIFHCIKIVLLFYKNNKTSVQSMEFSFWCDLFKVSLFSL